MNLASSSLRSLKCLLIISSVSEDMIRGGLERIWGLVEVVEDAVKFLEFFGSIQLETVMQRLPVFPYIGLLQHVLIICYYSTPLKVIPVEDVMQ